MSQIRDTDILFTDEEQAFRPEFVTNHDIAKRSSDPVVDPPRRHTSTPPRGVRESRRYGKCPFSSPGRKSGTAEDAVLQVAAAGSAYEDRLQRVRSRTCPIYCRCSDREIETGQCACAAESGNTSSGAVSPASSASSASASASPALSYSRKRESVRPIWNRRARADQLNDPKHIGTTMERADEDVVRADSAVSSNMQSPSKSVRHILSALEKRRRLTSSPGTGSEDTELPHSEHWRSPTSPHDPGQVGKIRRQANRAAQRDLSLMSGSHRLGDSRHCFVFPRTARSSDRGSEWVDGESESEYEALRRQRREQRDRMIRERIQRKRQASTTLPGRDIDRFAPSTSHRLAQDIQRLNSRISRPPSASSVAAFAANVSPSKRHGVRGDEQFPVLPSANPIPDLSRPHGTRGAVSTFETQYSAPDIQIGGASESKKHFNLSRDAGDQNLLHAPLRVQAGTRPSEDRIHDSAVASPSPPPPLSDISPSPASRHGTPASPSGFSFVPQEMIREFASPIASDKSSSPRRSSSRRTQADAQFVNVSARLPARSVVENRDRLKSALSAHIFADDSVLQKTGSKDACKKDSLSGDSILSSQSRKLVRFSSVPETIGSSSDVARAPSLDKQAAEDQTYDGHPPTSLRKVETVELEDMEESTSSAGSTGSGHRHSVTPIKLLPGNVLPSGFGAPIGIHSSKRQGTASPVSFSRHTLKRAIKDESNRLAERAGHNTPYKSPSTTLRPATTPILPGGLRLKHWSSADESSTVFTSPTKIDFDDLGARGKLKRSSEGRLPPPSYSSVAASRDNGSNSPSSPQLTLAPASTGLAALEEEPNEHSNSCRLSDEFVHPGQRAPDSPRQQPRESTPPPARDSRRHSTSFSCVDTNCLGVLEGNLADLNGIGSPSSRASSLGMDNEDRGAEHLPRIADDSLRLTLDQVVSSLRKTKQLETSVSVKRDLEVPDTMPVADGQVTSMPIPRTEDERLQLDLELLAERLNQLRAKNTSEHGGAKISDAVEGSVADRKLAAAAARLRDAIEQLGETPSPRQASSARWRVATAATVVAQALLFCFSLLVMQEGAERLYRSVYFDAFYPHLYFSDGSPGPDTGLNQMGFFPVRASGRALLQAFVLLDLHSWPSVVNAVRTAPLNLFTILAQLSSLGETGIDYIDHGTGAVDRAFIVPI